jgi:integrase
MPRLTKRIVDALAPSPAGAVYAWDDQLSGFGVKVLPSGSRRYIVKYRIGSGGRQAPQRWLTLGAHGAITCDQARDMAQQALAAVARGEDPQGDRLAGRQAPTVADLWARYEGEQLPLKKASTAKDDRRRWREIVEPQLGRMPVTAVSRADIDRLHKRLRETRYNANRVLSLLLRLFNVAEAWGWRAQGTNPCHHVERFKEESRERYLNADELVRLGTALDELISEESLWPEAAAAIRLLLLTGARLNEILTARWEWVDADRRTIELPDSKTGKKTIFLSTAAVQVLNELKRQRRDPESPFLLPGRSKGKPLNNLAKSWRRVCERAEIRGARLHDLRHTAASVAVARGGSLPIIGRLLGHRNPQTTQRYAHVDVDPALAIADEIGDAIGGALGIDGGSGGPEANDQQPTNATGGS